MSTENETKEKNLENNTDYSKLEAEVQQLSKVVPKLNAELQAKNNQLEQTSAELAALKSELEAANSRLRNAQLEDAASNPEQLQQLLEEETSRLRQEFGEKLTASEQQAKQLRDQLKSVTTVSEVMTKYAGDAQEATRDILESIVARDIHKDDATGQEYVTDSKGNKRYSPANPAIPMSPEEYIQELRAERSPLFKPKGIKTSAMEQGQVMGVAGTSNTNTLDGVDLVRFQTDEAYYNSIPAEKRAALAIKLGM